MSANQQTLSTSLRQEQQLSARQLQSLELLNLPLLDLEERLTQELAANPLLEAESDEEWQEPAPDPAPDPEPEDEATLDERAAESEEWADELPMPPAPKRADLPANSGSICSIRSPAPPPFRNSSAQNLR